MVSSIRDRLTDYQNGLLAKIGAAAKASDAEAILLLNGQLARTTALLSRMDDVGFEAEALLGNSDSRNGRAAAVATQKIDEMSVPGRGHGIKIRADFLDRAARAGLPLRPYRGAIFQSSKGRRIGIAVATERKPNRWFLGLGEGLFDAAVLLCAPNSGKVLDICLPPAFLAQHGRYLSQSGGQIKFNVARRDAHTILKIPHKTPERVERFIGAITNLDQ